eukprot:CAMPEP_0118934676 /NCGR_PEP_ID=MMETSP1169-20130426/13953_1 /TAXON_ID=36882 /ORGANISM="Pyramimonas obovata, Strain CCMP722" /LENGTH=387 /DNA_ID=CAMNT_0006877603 /DNA_START=73 /DNA_END=1237 /DNA_ORIENTATION=-
MAHFARRGVALGAQVLRRAQGASCNAQLSKFTPRFPVASFSAEAVGAEKKGGSFLGRLAGITLASAMALTPSVAAIEHVGPPPAPKVDVPPHPVLGSVVFYQYDVCPFCNKVKALLDYYKVPYQTVEVNPLTKNEIAWSAYKKVPIVTLNGEPLVDSTLIMTEIAAKLSPPKKAGFFGAKKQAEADAEEQKWREWVDDRLVHVITPNIYRTVGESIQAFDYITTKGNFTIVERYAAQVVGVTMMYALSKLRLKKKHNIEEERPALYEEMNKFTDALGARQFLGGNKPNLADISIFGVLRAVRGMDTWKDVMDNTKVLPWYERMEASVAEQEQWGKLACSLCFLLNAYTTWNGSVDKLAAPPAHYGTIVWTRGLRLIPSMKRHPYVPH